MQTIPLAVIANRWVEAIKDNDRINEFCQAKYGKDLSIFVGYDDAGAPSRRIAHALLSLWIVSPKGLRIPIRIRSNSYGVYIGRKRSVMAVSLPIQGPLKPMNLASYSLNVLWPSTLIIQSLTLTMKRIMYRGALCIQERPHSQ